MSRLVKSTLFWLVFVVVGAAAFVAAQSTVRPGDPTQAHVWVENRQPNEAVPVTVERMNGTVAVHVGSLEPSLVLAARAARQRWEYRIVTIDAGVLEQVGNDGWEAVSVVPSSGSVLLKRPR